ncbi:hypothetical protein P8452_59903 [Trifolium repens]|nr:hypothetical protein P8452_59903 [Trifolium repens]
MAEGKESKIVPPSPQVLTLTFLSELVIKPVINFIIGDYGIWEEYCIVAGMDKSFFKKIMKSYLNTSESSFGACSFSNFRRGSLNL